MSAATSPVSARPYISDDANVAEPDVRATKDLSGRIHQDLAGRVAFRVKRELPFVSDKVAIATGNAVAEVVADYLAEVFSP